jgi:hypothetical protein
MIQSTIRPTRSSGYRPCACRDCFEIAIGEPGAMCHACADAGCTGDGECQAPGAYGGDEEPESQPDPEPSEALTVPPTVTTAEQIREACLQQGFFFVSTGTYQPGIVLPRLLAALEVLAPHVHAQYVGPTGIMARVPAEAMQDLNHYYWDGAEGERLVAYLMMALDAAAPPGCMFSAEGAFHNLGFFRK